MTGTQMISAFDVGVAGRDTHFKAVLDAMDEFNDFGFKRRAIA